MDVPLGGDPDKNTMVAEGTIQDILSPMEPFIMRVQSLLVWENPRRSAVLFICVHGMFWYFSFTNCHFYSTISSFAIIFYFLHTWKRKIWPEIRVPPPVPEDTEGWIPVHPRLLSVPELSHHLAVIWCGLVNKLNYWREFRRRHPFGFCVIAGLFFLTLATLGRYIPDTVLLYVVVISILLWPCVLYHNLLQKFYMKFEPLFMKLDYSIKVKNQWTYREAGDPGVTSSTQMGTDGEMTSSVVADNESDFEEDFYPSSDPAVTAALARAITDSEDEGGTGGTSSTSMTPHLSKEPSINNSDNEDEKLDDMDEDFIPSIDVMPSIDLDHTDDEMLNDFSLSSEPTKPKRKTKESINFVPSHFDDSSSEEEDTLSHRPSAVSDLDALKMQMAQNIVAQTFSSVIGSALQSFTANLNDNASAASPRDRVAYTRTDSDEDITMDLPDSVTMETRNTQPVGERRPSGDSGDIDDIDDEFEFLDEYEVEEDEHAK